MAVINYNHGKFFSPSQSYMGYVFIACGIFASYYSLNALFLLIPGCFIAFTYTGTIIDTDKKRVRPYTSHFGIIRTGKWIETNLFTRFNITKANRRYTNISRGGVRFDMNISDIRLLLQNKDGSRKVVLNVYSKFEDARKEMEELSGILLNSENSGDSILNARS